MSLKISELREKDVESLQKIERELTENLFAARLQKRTGQLDNVSKISLAKRDLARVKTVLRARELGLEVIETASPESKEKKAKQAEAKTEKKAGTKPAKAAKVKAKAAKSAKKTKAAAKPAAKKAGKSAGKKK